MQYQFVIVGHRLAKVCNGNAHETEKLQGLHLLTTATSFSSWLSMDEASLEFISGTEARPKFYMAHLFKNVSLYCNAK